MIDDDVVARALGPGCAVVRRIAIGGGGAVYELAHAALGRVAAKVVAAGSAAAGSLRDEARLLGRVRHANVVAVHELGIRDDVVFMIMEYLEGVDLRTHLAGGPLRPRGRALVRFREAACGVAALHAAGVVHGDLKPANLMLEASADGERVKVFDLGLATSVEPDEAAPHVPGGTPAYMAPELWRRARPTPRSDQYALGLILHEVVAGAPAFAAARTTAYMDHHLRDDPPSLSDLVGDDAATRALAAIVARMTAKDPAARHASLADVVAELDAVVERAT